MSRLSGRQLLALAGKTPVEQWMVNQKVKGQVLPIGLDEIVDLAAHGVERFMTLPKDQTEGRPAPRRLFALPEEDVDLLDAANLQWETISDGGGQWLLVHQILLPAAFVQQETSVAFQIPSGYPSAALDMGYFSPAVKRVDGRVIPCTEAAVHIEGNSWQRWSRHYTATNPWRPGEYNVHTHFLLSQTWLQREAGGLGSMPGAMLSVEQLGTALDQIRAATSKPINVNFFTHKLPQPDPIRVAGWHVKLARFYEELGLKAGEPQSGPTRNPFDGNYCDLLEKYRPEVVSFHFGLPQPELMDRVRRMGAKIVASATTVTEARWLEEQGVDAVIAMGLEAGGHRGSFLTDDMSTQVGTMALVPQIVDAVGLPVIAAGGIADRRGVQAAFALGASAVQVGTAYLFTPEAHLSLLYAKALRDARDDSTSLTNIFTGRPARGIVNRLMRELGPLSKDAPEFPAASASIAPLRAEAEKQGNPDFISMWAGQAAALARSMPAGELTRFLAG